MRTPSKSATTANTILNQVAAEVGIQPVADPVSSVDPTFVQLRYLLNAAGEELVIMYKWDWLMSEATVNPADEDPVGSGSYPLPDDFGYMIDQTGWDRTNNVPLYGPLSPQDWQYLEGRDLVSSTIYASFRLAQGTLNLFPAQLDAVDIRYEYVSNAWVQNGDDPTVFTAEVQAGNDIPVYHRNLITRYLKVKYQEAKGLDSQKAQDTFNQMFAFMSGQNLGGEILNAGQGFRGFPYLNAWNSTPDSGYGGGAG
jgi:hypothetical protein